MVSTGCSTRSAEKHIQIQVPGEDDPLQGITYLVLDVQVNIRSRCVVDGRTWSAAALTELFKSQIAEQLQSRNSIQLVDATLYDKTRKAFERYHKGMAEFQPLFDEGWVTADTSVLRWKVTIELQVDAGFRVTAEQGITGRYLECYTEIKVRLADATGMPIKMILNKILNHSAEQYYGAEISGYTLLQLQGLENLQFPQVITALAIDTTSPMKASSRETIEIVYQSLTGDADIESLFAVGAFDTAFIRIHEQLIIKGGVTKEQRGFWLHDRGIAEMGRGQWAQAQRTFEAAHALTGHKASLNAMFQIRKLQQTHNR